MAEEGRVIRARRIELTDDRGDVTLVLEGGTEGGRGAPGLTMSGPGGNAPAIALFFAANGEPVISLYHPDRGSVNLSFDSAGRAQFVLETPEGEFLQFVPQEHAE